MLQKICLDILNEKWNYVKQMEFPLNAKKIAVAECFDNSIRQFFFAEITHYCKNIIKLLADNTNISTQLLNDEDSERMISILYDWVEFDAEKTKLILENAIQTELFFLLNPAKCLSMFLYKKNNECSDERPINTIIKEFEFITDNRSIITAIKEELLELSNTNETISQNDFTILANDIVFNITQKMEIADLLAPLKNIQTMLNNENIPLAIIDAFFDENDLAGVLTKIKEYAASNERESLSYNEVLDIINDTIDNAGIEHTAEVEIVAKNIEIPAEYIESIEIEVDNTINEIEEDNQLNIIEDAFNLENNPTNYQKETIMDMLIKLRSENLNPIEIEKIYLKKEKDFLTDFKCKLLG